MHEEDTCFSRAKASAQQRRTALTVSATGHAVFDRNPCLSPGAAATLAVKRNSLKAVLDFSSS